MTTSFARFSLIALFGLMFSTASLAQQPAAPPILDLGNAVVTGFSGTVPPDPAKRLPANKQPIDLTFINPDGASARILDIGKPGHVWDGSVFAAPQTLEIKAGDVGQVFGIALDDAPQPNVYLAATSAFGLNLVARGRDGAAERRKKGGPGTGWMKGQFGLDLQGGPGAIYKIDGRTGVPTLFANVTLDGVPNPSAGLGNLAYDAAHKQLFVSDLYTGMIHRFDLDGRDLGRYDHGVAGLGAAKLPTVAFDPKNRPNIGNAAFDSEKPETWGFAPAARRVFGLAVREDRLYYSVTSGPQIWSVGIARDGSFDTDPRWELDVPAQAGPLPISDIVFSNKGAMILAQRALIAASYDYSAFTRPGEPQVFRVWLKGPQDPPSPGRWKTVPEEYAVGFAGNFRNTNGGVALGYGYDQTGVVEPGACEFSLWTTGQNLRNAPALKDRLDPGGPLVVHGLQALPASPVRDVNTPPWLSYTIPYGDDAVNPRALGHMGSVRILTMPCPAGTAAPLQPVADVGPPAIIPIGCVGPDCRNTCTPTCICPPGTEMKRGECVKIEVCPQGTVMKDGECVKVCPQGFALRNGECVRILSIMPNECKAPMVPTPPSGACACPKPMIPGELQGTCRCPEGSVLKDGQCVPRDECKPPFVPGQRPGSCVCPQGTVLQDGKCVPQVCPAPLVPGPCIDGKPIDIGIEKTGATTPVQRPDYVFDIKVTNHGAPFSGAGVITVTETVPPGMTFNNIGGPSWSCVPPSGPQGTVIVCTYNGPGVTTGQVLPVIHVDARANGNGPYPPFTNCALVGTKARSDYTDTNPKNDQACVTVSKPDKGTVVVEKKVKNDTRADKGTIQALTFSIKLVCPPAVNTTFTLHDGQSHTESNVTYGSICTVTETGMPPPPPNACARGFHAVWLAPVVTPNGVSINAPLTAFTVVNELKCEPDEKICPPPMVMGKDGVCVCPPPMIPGAILNQCLCPQGTVLKDGQCIKVENECTPPLIMIPGVGCRCPEGTVLQGRECVKVTVCPPPMVPGPVAGQCICPPGTALKGRECVKIENECTPPLVMIPGVGCRCPQGTVLKGRECVKVETVCQPPMVPGPVAGQCICGPGYTQRGKECVKQIVCRPPLVPNATGTDCICPPGRTLRRGQCVEIERPKKPPQACPRGTERAKNGQCVEVKRERPAISPGDVINVLPGLIPGGGGRKGSDTGGGDKGGGRQIPGVR